MRLRTLEENPFNAETPLPELSRTITSTELFYVRTHFNVPGLDPATYRLEVDGAVGAPLELSLQEVLAFPARRITATLECAGNGRARLEPPVPGVRWGFGAVGTAHFTGTPLRHVLERAGVGTAAVEALFIGADRGEVEPGRRVAFERSLPLAMALHPDTLLAWEMNAEPLSPLHGFPLRLVVPRWYAVASVKWLKRIRLLTERFQGHYQTEKYLYEGEAETPDKTPVTTMRVRAVITTPSEGSTVGSGPREIAGMAWSGDAPVHEVEVSVDGGRSWRDVELGTPPSEIAWIPWRILWTPTSQGEHLLMARASDAAGHIQPLRQAWNAQGYGNNVVHQVGVKVN